MKFSLTFAVWVVALMFMGPASGDSMEPILTVLKSPTCGCCVKWMEHLHDNGFSTAVEEPENLEQQKAQLGIGPRYRSCHTAVSAQGFVLRGMCRVNLSMHSWPLRPKAALALVCQVCLWAVRVWRLAIGLCPIKYCFCKGMGRLRFLLKLIQRWTNSCEYAGLSAPVAEHKIRRRREK